MNKNQKVEFVSELEEHFKNSSSVIVAHYHGLNVDDIAQLRRELRQNGVVFKVAKNRLVKLAIRGTAYEPLNDILTGPTVFAFANEPSAVAKCLVKFAEEKEALKIIGGVVESEYFDSNNIKVLATLPSLDELRAKIIGVINAPAGRLASVLQGAAGQLARVFNAYASKE